MNPHYNQRYSYKEIETILKRIKQCILNGKYTISQNERRKENIEFINEYNIRKEKQEAILLQIQVDDFCHSLQNTKVGYEHETLYVFVPQVRLYNVCDEEEIVDIYTKFNLLELASGDRTVVISFHKKNKPIQYLFR